MICSYENHVHSFLLTKSKIQKYLDDQNIQSIKTIDYTTKGISEKVDSVAVSIHFLVININLIAASLLSLYSSLRYTRMIRLNIIAKTTFGVAFYIINKFLHRYVPTETEIEMDQ